MKLIIPLSLTIAALSVAAVATTALAGESKPSAKAPAVSDTAAARPADVTFKKAEPVRAKTEKEVQAELARKYRECMKANGVRTLGTGMLLDGVPQATSEKALAECKKFHPTKMWQKLAPKEAEEQRNYAKCMRGEGIDEPAPDANNELVVEVSWESPSRDYLKAHHECRDHLKTAMESSKDDPAPLDDPLKEFKDADKAGAAAGR